MSKVLEHALHAGKKYPQVFCKFLSANDVGATGGHQSGIYIPKNSYQIIFDEQGIKGENKDKFVKIKWQEDFETDSRFIYYGKGTRNEYRITRFGREFPFLNDKHLGDLFVLVKVSGDYYLAYILSSDEDIDTFLASFNMTPADTNRIIQKDNTLSSSECLDEIINNYVKKLPEDFPSTKEISNIAREIYYKCFGNIKDVIKNPDIVLIKWIEIEYDLFKAIENNQYKKIIAKPFETVEELIDCANTILNRRKSRAGKSLEHHLSEIFSINNLPFASQVITEGNKKPDFIFPGYNEYHDVNFNEDKLIFLGAKTTCKDRWRQILNEADRIKIKHLITLQQGISENQLKEMFDNSVILVVPQPYIDNFPPAYRSKIMTLKEFIEYVKKSTGE